MGYLFTSESVSEGHPDKVADQISDAVLDKLLAYDPSSKVACETLVTTGQVVLAGEVKTKAYVDLQLIAREVIKKIGYTKGEYMFESNSCGVLSAIHEQSPDINRGVERQDPMEQGAGDQGLMFGYACNETAEFMPMPIVYAHRLVRRLAEVRKNNTLNFLRPDGKSQVTIEYIDKTPVRVDAIVIAAQHNPDVSITTIREGITEEVIKRVIPPELTDDNTKIFINSTGRFVVGGPKGDCGMTGRKIIVDTYGGVGSHGGGAFSGKDPSKVDRSAAYATRHIAKNLVAAGVADEVLVQVSYAIGVAEPCGLFINTYGTSKVGINDGELAKKVQELFDLRPYAIEQNLKLRNPIYQETAAYGHMGRDYYVGSKTFNKGQKNEITLDNLEFFTWEKLDRVEDIKKAFNL